MDISKYTAGLGQKAEQLPPGWQCYTEAEVELIISRLSLDIREKLAPEERVDLLMLDNKAPCGAEEEREERK